MYKTKILIAGIATVVMISACLPKKNDISHTDQAPISDLPTQPPVSFRVKPNHRPALLNPFRELVKFHKPAEFLAKSRYAVAVPWPIAHTQKTLRLPQRQEYGNRTYFMGTQSQSGGGWVFLAETYPGVFGANGDAAVADSSKYQKGAKGELYQGKIVWWIRTDKDNQTRHGIGACNHPGNMSVLNNGVFSVACQEWPAKAKGFGHLAYADSGHTRDYALFYDVSSLNHSNKDYPVHMASWSLKEITSGKMRYNKLKSVGLVNAGEYSHLWFAGDDGLNLHYRIPNDFSPNSDNLTDYINKDSLLQVNSGGFDSGSAHVERFNINGVEANYLVDIDERFEKDGARTFAATGLTVAGAILNEIKDNKCGHWYWRVKMHKIEYNGENAIEPSISANDVSVNFAAKEIVTNRIRYNKGWVVDNRCGFTATKTKNWCGSTFGYYLSKTGEASVVCWDEDVTGKMKQWSYNAVLEATTKSGGEDHNTDDPLYSRIIYSDYSADDYMRLDHNQVDDFEKGDTREYPVTISPAKTLSALQIDIRGNDGWTPGKLRLEKANRDVIFDWVNSSAPPYKRLDGNCRASEKNYCSDVFTTYRTLDKTTKLSLEGSWSQIDGTAMKIAVGNAKHVWGLQSNGSIWQRDIKNNSWMRIQADAAKDISVGSDGTMWAVKKSDGSIWRRDGHSWEKIDGTAMKIAVGSAKHIWGLQSNGSIWQWNDKNNSWKSIKADAAIDISVGSDGAMWAVKKKDGSILRRDGHSWDKVEGTAIKIAVGSAKDVWGLQSNGSIWQWNDKDNSWNPIKTDAAKDISVGSDGTIWTVKKSDGSIWQKNRLQKQLHKSI